jgi:hypothetical protein
MSRKFAESMNSGIGLLEIMAFGIKGAALAALGEMPAGGFFTTAVAVAAPFGDRKEGVKLGESTLSAFLD